MASNLFSRPAEYTIDSCCLIDIFNGTGWTSKNITPGLWQRVAELIQQGVIISHIEVFGEIKKDGSKGEELYNWVQANKEVFKEHDELNEGEIIRSMSKKYKAFVNDNLRSTYADPWLIAQAKHRNLKIISEETRTDSPNPEKYRIPNICEDPIFNIECINLLGLSKEREWTYQ